MRTGMLLPRPPAQWILLGLMLAFSISACEPQSEGHDPIAALDRHTEDPTLGRGFWLDLARKQNPTWQTALDHCRSQAQPTPNCKTVLRVEASLEVPGFVDSGKVHP